MSDTQSSFIGVSLQYTAVAGRDLPADRLFDTYGETVDVDMPCGYKTEFTRETLPSVDTFCPKAPQCGAEWGCWLVKYTELEE